MAFHFLISRTDAIGDNVLTLPVVNDIRQAFPDARISYCTSQRCASLVSLCPQVDQILTYPAQGTPHDLFVEMFATSIDAAVMCYPKPVCLAWKLARKSVPIRVGSTRRWWGFLFNHGSSLSRSGSDIHEAEANRQLGSIAIAALGGDVSVCQQPAQAVLQINTSDEQCIKGFLSRNSIDDYLVIQPGSRGSSMDWPLEYMAQAGDKLVDRGKTVVFHIGPGEQHIEKQLQSVCQQQHIYAGSGSSDKDAAMDIPQLAALLQQARCVLANSTGPLHLAAALATPVIGIYPPVHNLDPSRWRPLGDKQIILMPQHKALWKSRHEAPYDIMRGISVEQVCQSVERIW